MNGIENKIPILKIGEMVLVSIRDDLHDSDVLALQDELAEAVVKYHSRGLLIDISALEIVDSFVGRVLVSIAKCADLLGAETIIVGMRPAIAIAMVELGLGLKNIKTALNTEAALEMLSRSKTKGSANGSLFKRANHNQR